MIEPFATQQPATWGTFRDDTFPRSIRDASDIDRLEDQIAERALAGSLDQGSRADHLQVVVHVDAEV
jgi:hypothetical protein